MDGGQKIINLSNLLKNQATVTINDYEKYKLSQEYNKLYTNNRIENNEEVENKKNERFYNLSLKQILLNLSQTLVDIINEFSLLMSKEDKTLKQFIDIIIKDTRMIYVGLLMIIFSLMLFFISVTS